MVIEYARLTSKCVHNTVILSWQSVTLFIEVHFSRLEHPPKICIKMSPLLVVFSQTSWGSLCQFQTTSRVNSPSWSQVASSSFIGVRHATLPWYARVCLFLFLNNSWAKIASVFFDTTNYCCQTPVRYAKNTLNLLGKEEIVHYGPPRALFVYELCPQLFFYRAPKTGWRVETVGHTKGKFTWLDSSVHRRWMCRNVAHGIYWKCRYGHSNSERDAMPWPSA